MKTRDASGAESGFALGQPCDGVSEMWGGVGLSAVGVSSWVGRVQVGHVVEIITKVLLQNHCTYRQAREREREGKRGGGERESERVMVI